MIPPLAPFLRGLGFALRRHGLDVEPFEPAVLAALAHARELAADDPHAEPASLFLAFACRPRAIPGGWRVVAPVLARAHASAVGLVLDASMAELVELRMRVVVDRLAFEDVRQWFAARMRPR